MSPQQSDPRELIGPFVLGACTPEEEAEVRAHIVASAAFRAEVESFDIVHDALLEAPEPSADVAPGPELKRSIMAQVQAEASLFAAAGPDERAAIRREAEDVDPLVPLGPDDRAPLRGAVEPAPNGRRNAFLEALRHPARATALAAVLVALIVGGIVLGSGGETTREVAIQATAKAGNNASGRIVLAKDESTLRLNGFPGAGAGKQYQVWLQTGTEDPKPTKVLFSVDAKGHGEATIPGDLGDVDQVLVTAEPRGGSPAPTSDPVLHAQI